MTEKKLLTTFKPKYLTKNKGRELNKKCSCCGKDIEIILYKDKTYRGGHYFGKIPISSKKEWEKAMKSGTHKTKIGGMTFEVLNKYPKPYKYLEYWECPKCYWGKEKSPKGRRPGK